MGRGRRSQLPEPGVPQLRAQRDAELYGRSVATLLACWDENARGSDGAEVIRLDGVAAAVFPTEPERSVYNNAVLERGLEGPARGRAVEAMEAAYAEAGIASYAAWAHESEEGMREELGGRSFTEVETTRAMGMSLADLPAESPKVDLGPPDWATYLRIIGVPRDFLAGADRDAFHVLVARLDGEDVAAGMAFDHDGDCGIFNLGTLEHARRRGIATALTARLLHDARERGCTTATLQSTPMAEGIYVALGFRDLGRILEHAPSKADART